MLLLGGIISAFTIPLNYLPNMKDNKILVTTIYNGLSAEQIKNVITVPIENALSSLHGLKNITSTIRDGCSFTTVELQYSTDINTAIIDTKQIIDQLTESLPEGCLTPEISIPEKDCNRLLTLSIIPENHNLYSACQIANTDIKHQLQILEGVGSIKVKGGINEEIHIKYSPESLALRGISPEYIAEVLINQNFEYPAGIIRDSEKEYILKTQNKFTCKEDIENALIPVNQNIYKLKDISEIDYSSSDSETIAFYNNQKCIQLQINKKNNTNLIILSNKIKSLIEKFKLDYPDLSFYLTNDSSIEITDSINQIINTLIVSVLITFSVIFLFFREGSVAMILTIPIPLCILFSILCLKITGNTLNQISLSGISISIGMIVDSSIITFEAIHKYDSSIYTYADNVSSAISKVSKSIINSTLTTIIVFIPFIIFPGLIGDVFSSLSLAVISSIFLSSVLSMTFIPAVFSLLKYKRNNKELSFSKLEQKYGTYLYFISHNNRSIFLSAIFIFLFILNPLLLKDIQKDFIPVEANNKTSFILEYPYNYSLTKIQKCTSEVLNSIHSQNPNLISDTFAGFELSDFSQLSNIQITNHSVFVNVYSNDASVLQSICTTLSENNIKYSIIKNTDSLSSTLDIKEHFIKTTNTKEELERITKNIPEALPNYSITEYSFKADDSLCAHYKIQPYYISNYLYNYYEGINCGYIEVRGTKSKILLKPMPSSLTNTLNTSININSTFIQLSSLGTLTLNSENKILFRYNKKDAVTFNSKPEHIACINSLSEKIKELLSVGFFFVLLIFILLYCILGAQLESFTSPLILLISILPGFSGAITSLYIFNMTLNLNSILSLIILSGISVNNSIILFETVQNSHTSSQKTILNKLSKKIIPITLTTLTSILSLLPFIFLPHSTEAQRSMAIALTGGLVMSLFSSLTIIPIYIFKKNRNLNK